MTQDVNQDVQQRLQELRREYGAWLGEELAELAGYASGRQANDRNRDEWLGVRDRLHRLAGSAGTFGFPGVGETCRVLEQQLDVALSDESQREFEAFCQRLGALQEEATLLSSTQAVSLPLSAPDEPTQAPFGTPSYPLIYVLEDDQGLGQQLCQMLESFHYRAQHFMTGEALESACERQRPDALILDLHLGENDASDGLAVGEAIQQRMVPPLPLFVTAQSQDFAVQLRAVRAGVEGFFSRPLEPIRLADLLEKHLRHHRMPPSRVLMLDDDKTVLAYNCLMLEEAGFSVMTLSQPESILEAMDTFAPEVLVLDVKMPQCSGPELAQIVRYHPRWLQVPIVYLSASDDANAQLAAMTKAGDDFLAKPIAPESLVASVTARARRARALAAALSRDGLTGLLKHADIKERLASSLARAHRHPQPLCAVMLDIDHFKHVNDTHGHLVGDDVIRALANLLRRRLRESDLIGRYGGEEFLVVLHDCALAKAVQIIDELREAFAALRFGAGDASFSCTFSAGVIAANSLHDSDGLIGEADQCLYLAKRAGRDRVVAGDDLPL